MKQLKNSIMLSVTGTSGVLPCCAFPCIPGDDEDDEPTIFREVEVTLSSQMEMGSSSSSNFLSRLETSTGTKEVVVLLPLKVLKIKFKDPRNLH